MYKLELNDKEVRAIGEKRWVRKHRKKLAGIGVGGLVSYLCIVIPLVYYAIHWINYIAIPYLVIWCLLLFKIWVMGMDKAGKRFLKNIQED